MNLIFCFITPIIILTLPFILAKVIDIKAEDM